MKTSRYVVGVLLAVLLLAGCREDGPAPDIVYYPYQTVYGDVCATYEVRPGCTFNRDGTRVTVYQDPDYNRFGNKTDDLLFVVFDGVGHGNVYSVDIRTGSGVFYQTANASDFPGYISASTIGVGTSGRYWEDVANGTYWIGRNNVLYSANNSEAVYLEAIN